jgi:phospho-N-acetylmuramoyl-pentapeptide-transferase
VSASVLVSLIGWIVFGFAIAAPSAAIVQYVMGRLQVRQQAYEDAPATHRRKTGTPTMGGVAFVVALAAALVVVRPALLVDLVLLVVLCAAVGAIDDALMVLGGSNRGLRARTKFLATALAATIFLRAIDNSDEIFPRGVLFHGAGWTLVAPHWLWFVLGILAITATVHAVNLTDGLDGLAAGTIVPPLLALAVVGAATPPIAASLAAAVGAGASLGFLPFNRHPAKLFMGDTGSLALGALLAGVAILTGEMLLLLLIGAVFVAEALSVIVQVGYFKASGGKRVLRMSPLHHHFELGGWPETKVTQRFWLASLLASLVGWAIAR